MKHLVHWAVSKQCAFNNNHFDFFILSQFIFLGNKVFFTYAGVNITTHNIGLNDSYWNLHVNNRQHCLCDLYFRTWLSVQSAFFLQALTECIGTLRVRKYWVVCLCVWVCVCLSVCPRWYGETIRPVPMKLSKMGSLYMSSCAHLCFSSLAY